MYIVYEKGLKNQGFLPGSRSRKPNALKKYLKNKKFHVWRAGQSPAGFLLELEVIRV
jgi:hypothetical protein